MCLATIQWLETSQMLNQLRTRNIYVKTLDNVNGILAKVIFFCLSTLSPKYKEAAKRCLIHSLIGIGFKFIDCFLDYLIRHKIIVIKYGIARYIGAIKNNLFQRQLITEFDLCLIQIGKHYITRNILRHLPPVFPIELKQKYFFVYIDLTTF